MSDWLSCAPGVPAVLVTVAIVEGSGPRECGARMLVQQARVFDTIGGGHLELRAVEIARAMLADGRARHFERFALGPSLGQCCGGVVHLAFELAGEDQFNALAARRREDTWRVSAIDGAPDWALTDGEGRALAGNQTAAPRFARDRGAYVMQEPDGRRWMVDPVLAPRAHLVLFGAGHVGAAIVRVLAHLPCNVTWVDEREDMFPEQIPANVTVEASDVPEALVAEAPPGASYLVMTHSHALDQRLTEAIMARPDTGWFGLIGSKTKRRQFEHRLRARGVLESRIEAMVCPIGVEGIKNKAPAVIAVAVCAQLLAVWEAAAAPPPPSLPLKGRKGMAPSVPHLIEIEST